MSKVQSQGNKPNRLTMSGNLQSLRKTEKPFRGRVSVVPCALSEGTPLADRGTDWSRFRRVGSYRRGNRNHLRLICHGNLWNCTDNIGWSTELDWRWWYAGHFGLADLNSVGVSDLNSLLNCRCLQLVDMSTRNNPWCHLHLVHQRTCLFDNQP